MIKELLKLNLRKLYQSIKCIKLYFTKISEKETRSIKMCCINIHFSVNPFTFSVDCLCKYVYIIVTHYQNKTLYNRVLSGTIFMVLLMLSCIQRTIKSQVIQYDTKHNAINYFCDFPDCHTCTRQIFNIYMRLCVISLYT